MKEAEHKAKLDAPEPHAASTLASARREHVEAASMNQVARSYVDRDTSVVSRNPPADLNRETSRLP
jgi:hypothetical protein